MQKILKMQNYSGNNKTIIEPGAKINLLEVIERVVLLRQHDLFYDTPKSYLLQGPVWECHCHGCGQRKLISGAQLTRGKLKSCGCLRQRMWQEARQRKIEKLKRAINLRNVNNQIKIEKYKLAELNIQLPTDSRDKLVDECSARLRNLYGQKAGLTPRKTNKKIPDPETLQEIHKTEREIFDTQQKYYSILRQEEQKTQKQAYRTELKQLQEKLRNLAKGKII